MNSLIPSSDCKLKTEPLIQCSLKTHKNRYMVSAKRAPDTRIKHMRTVRTELKQSIRYTDPCRIILICICTMCRSLLVNEKNLTEHETHPNNGPSGKKKRKKGTDDKKKTIPLLYPRWHQQKKRNLSINTVAQTIPRQVILFPCIQRMHITASSPCIMQSSS